MVAFSNLVAVLAGVVGLIVLVVGRVPIPGRTTGKGTLVRLTGVLLLVPWPASQGLALLAKVAQEMDGNPPDSPETVQLITAFVQLVLLFVLSATTLVLILLATTAKSSGRHENPGESAT